MQTRAPLSRDDGAFTIHKEEENCYAKVKPKEPASGRFYAVFHVFRRRKPDFPAVSRCTGGHCRVAGLCRICGQRDRSAGYWRDRCRACRRAVRAGRACASAICADICAAGLPVDRSVSGHPAHGEYIVPNAHAARWRRCNAAADLLYCVLCGSVFRCTAPGKADKLARTHSMSDADRTDFRAVFRLPVSSGGGALRRADRRLRFAAEPDGHSGWLPDNGYAGGTQFRRGYRAEYSGLRYRGRTAGAPQHHPCRLDCRRNAASDLRDADARWRTVRCGMAGRLDWRGYAEQYCQRSVWPGRAGAACRNFRHCMLQYLCRPDCLRRSVFP